MALIWFTFTLCFSLHILVVGGVLFYWGILFVVFMDFQEDLGSKSKFVLSVYSDNSKWNKQ